MALPSGLSSQFGIKTESVVGTGVTVTLFNPLNDPPAIANVADRLPVMGIQAGRTTQWAKALGKQKVGGTIKMHLYNKPMATFMTHMFGSVVDAGAGPYTHTSTPGSLKGKSFTAQGGLPDIAGTVNPFTWTGCKIKSWTIAAQVGQIASLDLDVFAMAEDADGTPALATATYLSGILPFTFVQCSITSAAASLGVVSSMTLTGNNGLAEDRFGLGSATAGEALDSDRRSYTGTIEVEFLSMVAYNLYLAGTDVALVFTFTNGTDLLVITTNAYYTGATPTGSGSTTLKQSLPFTCQHATTDAGCITAVLTNAEALSTV